MTDGDQFTIKHLLSLLSVLLVAVVMTFFGAQEALDAKLEEIGGASSFAASAHTR